MNLAAHLATLSVFSYFTLPHPSFLQLGALVTSMNAFEFALNKLPPKQKRRGIKVM
jgi:hypothetical protein